MTEVNIKKVLNRFEEMFANSLDKNKFILLARWAHSYEANKKGETLTNLIKDLFRESKHQILKELWNGEIV